MFKTVVATSVVAASLAANSQPREYYEKEFFEHMTKYNVNINDGQEFTKRLQIFANNLDEINAHNADTKQTYKLGQNKFTHLSFDEFLDAVRIGGARIPNLRRGSDVHPAPKDKASLPAAVDWSTLENPQQKNVVTAVKNQGSCGSCWSFSTTGALEGAYRLKYDQLVAFSEQQLVSCDTAGQDAGCNGGWMDDAFTFVKNNGGLTTEEAYPYTSGTTGKSGTCVSSGYTNNANVAPQSYTDVEAGSVDALMSAVAQQPVSIAIQANQRDFQSYKSGVLTGRCGNRLDHGVLAVGYGTLDGTDYWKVKNSWGADWGLDGYILIERSNADLCGVLDAASYPNL